MTDRELIKEPDFSKAGFGKPQGVINTLNKQPEPEPLVDGWPLYSGLPEPEPVAWMYNGNLHEFDPSDWAKGEVIPLYTAPPQREWQWLTDEEIEQSMKQAYAIVQGRNLEGAFARAIEAKLKEKNHDS